MASILGKRVFQKALIPFVESYAPPIAYTILMDDDFL